MGFLFLRIGTPSQMLFFASSKAVADMTRAGRVSVRSMGKTQTKPRAMGL